MHNRRGGCQRSTLLFIAQIKVIKNTILVLIVLRQFCLNVFLLAKVHMRALHMEALGISLRGMHLYVCSYFSMYDCICTRDTETHVHILTYSYLYLHMLMHV